ncbi:MAG: hypothetical protein ACF8R7_02635 [Phycisphaerales bacterium JB039]
MRSVWCIAAAGLATSASGQCAWDSAFGVPGADISEGLFEPAVGALLEVTDSFGPGLYAGGLFAQMGGADARALAHWDGAAWSGLASGLEIVGPARFENPPYVQDMSVYDDGHGPKLYVIGNFNTADPDGAAVPADQVASWDGSAWAPVGGGLGPVSPFGAGPQPLALEVYDGALYAAGFLREDLGSPADSIARFDGDVWRDVGGAFIHAMGWIARPVALAVFDGELYAAGEFVQAPGGVDAIGIARWDGSAWRSVGAGVDGEIKAMAVYDDGGGPALYAGGAFAMAGGTPAANIARWDGSSWSAVGAGIERVDPGTTTGGVFAMAVFDDGAGPALYVGGQFSAAGGQPASNLARWDGAWAPVAGTIGGTSPLPWMTPMVSALAPSNEGLIVGGFFDEVGDSVAASSIARYMCEACYADCDGSGGLDFFDFLCFQNEFAAGAAYADCDGSGSLDFFDFLCFQNAFAAGCP